MFNKDEFKKLCEERENVDIYNDWALDNIWKILLNLICKDEQTFNGFIEYMRTEMTADEYSTLSEISDEIADMRPSLEFIEAYKGLALKYPEETKNYQIDNFIRDAETSVKISLKEAKKKK
ncbi:MAG: hypothetical protein ACTTIZ_08865 [Treponema sp.]